MKQILSKIAYFTLALLVLFSTFSFTVDKHYCGDFLVDVSFLGDVEVCADDISSENILKTKKCCKDEVQQFEGQDELQNNKVKNITFKKDWFFTAFVISYKNLFIENQLKNRFYQYFLPPYILADYQVLFQSFLI